MMSFDSIHNAALEPPEPQLCAPGEHSPDPATFRVSEEDRPNMVALANCEMCGAVGDLQPSTGDFDRWEL